MARSRRRLKDSRTRTGHDVKLNITPMMDIFTIILVFLLKAFSAQGQLVTPAPGLTLPTSTITSPATESLSIKILSDKLLVEDTLVLDSEEFRTVLEDKKVALIAPLQKILSKYAEGTRRSTELFGGAFSGQITIHGDSNLPYSFLTRVMYTCGQTGYPVMKLLVYREE